MPSLRNQVNAGNAHAVEMIERLSGAGKTVLQVFHRLVVYGKEHNNSRDREQLCRWLDAVPSHNGYLHAGTLVLPQQAVSDRSLFERSDLIVLTDHQVGEMPGSFPQTSGESAGEIVLLQLGSRVIDYAIFRLRRCPGGIEIELNYSGHSSSIGLPARADYRLARLVPGCPARITINGKTDFSLSGRLARTYRVHDYVFVLLGDLRRFAVNPEETLKTVPWSQAKHVDLREIMF